MYFNQILFFLITIISLFRKLASVKILLYFKFQKKNLYDVVVSIFFKFVFHLFSRRSIFFLLVCFCDREEKNAQYFEKQAPRTLMD